MCVQCMHMYIQGHSLMLVEVKGYHHVSSTALHLILYIYLFYLFIWGGAPVPMCKSGDQKTASGSWFFPSAVWISGQTQIIRLGNRYH